jgi:membrane associated rhomboid family serine protease
VAVASPEVERLDSKQSTVVLARLNRGRFGGRRCVKAPGGLLISDRPCIAVPQAGMTGRMERNRAINLPPVVLWLSVSFTAVHVVRQLISEPADEWVLLTFAFIPSRYGAEVAILSGGEAARFWSPVTYAFLHADWVHLFVNVIWMASFGGALARRFGAARFLTLSVVSAIAAAGLHYVLYATEEGGMIGASGAVSGMMAGTARFAFSPDGPLAGGRTAGAFRVPAEPILLAFRNRRVVGFVVIWFAVNILFGFAGGMVAGISGQIAWEAHIGGFLAGLLCFPLLDPVRTDNPPAEKLESSA